MAKRAQRKSVPQKATRASDKTLHSGPLTIKILSSAKEPTLSSLDAWEQTQSERIAAAAANAQARFPQQRERIGQWVRGQHQELTERLKGIKGTLELAEAHESEGAQFRQRFLDKTPAEVNEYLCTHPVDVWWLAGFSGDNKLAQRMREKAKRRRPKARGRSKWPKEVHDHAQACYREWRKAAVDADGPWGTTWRKFAPVCLKRIRDKTGVQLKEEQLRRFILPAKNFPRPT